jgi:hypothetical protein
MVVDGSARLHEHSQIMWAIRKFTGFASYLWDISHVSLAAIIAYGLDRPILRISLTPENAAPPFRSTGLMNHIVFLNHTLEAHCKDELEIELRVKPRFTLTIYPESELNLLWREQGVSGDNGQAYLRMGGWCGCGTRRVVGLYSLILRKIVGVRR